MRWSRIISLYASLLAIFAANPPVACADEILDQIQSAIEMYQAGDYAGAAAVLDFAALRMRELRSEEIAAAMPAPLPGWAPAEDEAPTCADFILPGGIGAQRSYVRDGAQIEVRVLMDTPMLQAVQELLANPMMVSSSGRQLVRIRDQKAVVEYKPTELRGEIQIVVAASLLVTISGRGVAWPEMEEYANAINYAALAASKSKR